MRIRCHCCKEWYSTDIASTKLRFRLFCLRCRLELYQGFWISRDELNLVTSTLQQEADEWLANFERVKALEGVLPKPALDVIAKELGVKDWELSE